MNDKDSIIINEKGRNIGIAFRCIQQIFRETSQVMKELDALMGKDWRPTYGNRTTKEVTTHLDDPEHWLVEASFRIYDNIFQQNVRKGITVAYWSEAIDEPILISGKLEYVVDEKTGNIKYSEHWDLWQAWFDKSYKGKIANGTIYKIKPEESELKDYVKEAQVFAIPLVSLESKKDIISKIYDTLIKL